MIMSTTLLLEPYPFHSKWKNQFSLPRIQTFTTSSSISIPTITKPKCHFNSKTPFSLSSNSKPPLWWVWLERNREEINRNTETDACIWTKIWDTLRKPTVATILIGILLMCDPNIALAASGGRMGGRSFSRSSSSSSSSSRSYSTSSSSPSRSYSSSSPPRSDSESSSSSSPNYYSSSTSYSVQSTNPQSRTAVGVIAPACFLIGVILGFILARGFLSDHSEGHIAAGKTTVLELQVGLSGTGHSLQSDLSRIAEVADTSSSEGLSYILTESTLALLRNPEYCISGYSSVDIKRGIEDGEERFNQLSIEERRKIDEETLVNVNNIKRQSMRSQRSNGLSNEYIVITILVAAEGELKLPSISGSGNLKEALEKLGSIPSSKLLAVEVLWTPQNENDTLSEREFLEDYPLLRPF